MSKRDWLSVIVTFVILVVASATAFGLGTFLADKAHGQEVVCTTVGIEHPDHGTPVETDRQWVEGAPTTAIVGHFMWFDYSPGDNGGPDTISFDVSDPTVVSATGCSDGSVTIEHADPECTEDMACWNCETMGNLVCGPDAPDPVDIGTPLTVEPTAFCETHHDTLERYCRLPNLVLVVS